MYGSCKLYLTMCEKTSVILKESIALNLSLPMLQNEGYCRLKILRRITLPKHISYLRKTMDSWVIAIPPALISIKLRTFPFLKQKYHFTLSFLKYVRQKIVLPAFPLFCYSATVQPVPPFFIRWQNFSLRLKKHKYKTSWSELRIYGEKMVGMLPIQTLLWI